MIVKDILNYLNKEEIVYQFIGDENASVEGFSSLSNYKIGSFTWVKKRENIPNHLDCNSVELVFTNEDLNQLFRNSIITQESKRAFFSSIEHFYSNDDSRPPVGSFTYIGPKVKLGKNVRIGHNCTLDGDITIGDSTVIWNNVSIINKVTIGSNCEIQSGAVIGHDGFGYTEDDNHIKTMVKHFGGVSIGNNVLISSNVCVCRGTIDDTIISNGAKIDNLSHIAHNCKLGFNSALAFPCWLGGSSTLQDNAYVAAGVIRNQCIVGENGFVGMGAIVTKNVQPDTIVVGNPAKPFKKEK